MNNISTTTIDPTAVKINIVSAGILQYGGPSLFILGMIGCILNIIIFFQPLMRKNSCAIYFHANSWANLFSLSWGLLADTLTFFTHNDPATYNDIYCKIRFFMIDFSQYSSRAFLVLACLDRFLLCSISVRQRQFCRPIIAKKMIVLGLFFCACISIYVLITYRPHQTIRPCMVATEAGFIYESIGIPIFNALLPALSMSILGWLTVKRLKENAKRVGREKIRVDGKDNQLVIMLIAQVVLFLVTNIPFVGLILYLQFTENIPILSKSPDRIAIEALSAIVFATVFPYGFNGWSFFVYTLTAPSFRHEFIMIFPRSCLCKTPHNNDQHARTHTSRIHPTNQNIASINL
ncbi:unnamed protein product [Adineta steineri]|uniref:G-protein coupled receptors family 1 profile domain-containing protein n=1 Tax=Adineta steineri TaxID=433720 RepID=A0A815FPT3_9BILA|nr:unnamed protein product [Adineta steineri]CAF3880361.1 unnamed protein product [Adineta steineri]